tara:strand:- start:197 stop:436 length:240 start_codon:yes stop_codon:yes gene_type:complete
MYILLLLIMSAGCGHDKHINDFQKNNDVYFFEKEKLSFNGNDNAEHFKLKLKETEYDKTKLLYKKVNYAVFEESSFSNQ